MVKFVLNGAREKPESIDDLGTKIDVLLRNFNKTFSTYDEGSEISLINKNSNKERGILISKEISEGIVNALRFSDFTKGKFDPSISPLVDLWGFGRIRKETVPLEEDIAEFKKLVGYEKIRIMDEKLYLAPQMEIDLSAIAKGRAVDLIGEALEKEEINNYLVEVGGEVRARGDGKDGKGWSILIISPDFNAQEGALIVRLNNLSMATSGDYLNYFEKEGKRYSHIIDPDTGYPINHKLASISIIAESCEEADALATAILVMGEKEGRRFVEENDISAHFIYREKEGFTTFTTRHFKKQLRKKAN